MTQCIEEKVSCRSGNVKLLVCNADLLAHPSVRKQVFPSINIGSLLSQFENDWSKAYFLYLGSPRGDGFYLEGDLDAFDDPECGETVLPLLERMLANTRVSIPTYLRMILSRRVFRQGYIFLG